MAITSTVDTTSSTVPSNIKTTAQAKKEAEQAVLNGNGGAMGQTAFLTLFTAQLKSQNPLDPMDNTAFVSQLAQFSQLEATTKMSDSMTSLVKTMSTDRMTSAASLLGKKVSLADGQAMVANSEGVDGVVSLPSDVDSISLKVFSASGQLVRTGSIGAQKKGEFPFTWDGNDNAGNKVADGKYRIEATTLKFGKESKVPVSTLATVKGVSTDAVTGDMKVDVGNNTTMSMSEIKRIGN
jgi:flagellar basal-body rod modification protein FlgD